MPKIRLDILLMERGLVESRAKAQALIMAGQVRVNGQTEGRVSIPINLDAIITLDSGPRYVSRGGDKLNAALNAFLVDVNGCICADVGSSTGGFTDCLLQHGAARVYALDVGKGLLHWKLRNDPRVVVMESTNARHLRKLPEIVDVVVVDASFISLKILLPVINAWNKQSPGTAGNPSTGFRGLVSTRIIALIKPQFEAGRLVSAKHKGVIRDPEIHKAVLTDVLTFAKTQGLILCGLIRSPVTGPKGNSEFLVLLAGEGKDHSVQELVDNAVPTSEFTPKRIVS